MLTGDHLSDPLHRVGLISDTHGLIRPAALDALRDSELIIHCGDVGDAAVLEALRTLSPVRAIRGNSDKSVWARSLPTHDVVEIGGHAIYQSQSSGARLICLPIAFDRQRALPMCAHRSLRGRNRANIPTPADTAEGDSRKWNARNW